MTFSLADVYSVHGSFLLWSVCTHLGSKDFRIETPEEDQFLIKTYSVYKDNKGLCLTEIYLFMYLHIHKGMANIQLTHNLIPIPWNESQRPEQRYDNQYHEKLKCAT
jgi:hypothetical protein